METRNEFCKLNKLATLIVCLLLSLISMISNAQNKWYSSSKNIISTANGMPAFIESEKKSYFQIYVYGTPKVNDYGFIEIQDTPQSQTPISYHDSFKIYKIELRDDGIYNYWTDDISQNGQIVLFELDFLKRNLELFQDLVVVFGYHE